jgi:iron(III) transport system permease protein
LLLGTLSFLVLPWYFLADTSVVQSLGGVFGAPETASGVVQAAHHDRHWLWVAAAALALAGYGAWLPAGPRQGRVLLLAATLGLVGLLASGFAIGAKGWSFAWLEQGFGALAVGQFGIGLGGALTLLALLMLFAAGLARLGYFRADFFVAGAVVGCAALLLLFIALPVCKALTGAFLDDTGGVALASLAERIGNERVWGLACVVGSARCGAAWNTLFLALATAAGTTLLGTLIALMAERSQRRLAKPLNVLALLPIITPPFVVGLGSILLFGRAGIVNQALEWAFGIAPSR